MSATRSSWASSTSRRAPWTPRSRHSPVIRSRRHNFCSRSRRGRHLSKRRRPSARSPSGARTRRAVCAATASRSARRAPRRRPPVRRVRTTAGHTAVSRVAARRDGAVARVPHDRPYRPASRRRRTRRRRWRTSSAPRAARPDFFGASPLRRASRASRPTSTGRRRRPRYRGDHAAVRLVATGAVDNVRPKASPPLRLYQFTGDP